MNILILEDEQPAGEKLIDNIKAKVINPNIIWKRSIIEAIDFLNRKPQLDIIFSDIELLDGNVFGVFETILPKCPIIFCTAYDTFYIDAFKTNGISYLLKPYSQESFENAWNKFSLLFKSEKEIIPIDIVTQLKYLIESERNNYKKTFSIKKNDGVYILKSPDIIYFQAQGDFVLALDINDRNHIINDSLTNIERIVDQNMFFRINRSEIINRNSILKYNKHIKNRLVITLTNSKAILYTSNSKTPGFRLWIEN